MPVDCEVTSWDAFTSLMAEEMMTKFKSKMSSKSSEMCLQLKPDEENKKIFKHCLIKVSHSDIEINYIFYDYCFDIFQGSSSILIKIMKSYVFYFGNIFFTFSKATN